MAKARCCNKRHTTCTWLKDNIFDLKIGSMYSKGQSHKKPYCFTPYWSHRCCFKMYQLFEQNPQSWGCKNSRKKEIRFYLFVYINDEKKNTYYTVNRWGDGRLSLLFSRDKWYPTRTKSCSDTLKFVTPWSINGFFCRPESSKSTDKRLSLLLKLSYLEGNAY